MSKYLDDAGLAYFLSKCSGKFQAKLISGQNIKTVNSQSILGSGNINTLTHVYRHDVHLDIEQGSYSSGSFRILASIITTYSTPISDIESFLAIVFQIYTASWTSGDRSGNAHMTLPVQIISGGNMYLNCGQDYQVSVTKGSGYYDIVIYYNKDARTMMLYGERGTPLQPQNYYLSLPRLYTNGDWYVSDDVYEV